MIGAIVAFALIHLCILAGGGNYAVDYEHGIRPAAQAVLHGRTPYPPADPGVLLARKNAYVTPPPVALLAIPFAPLPYGVSIVLWNVLCACSLIAALGVLGVREPRFYALALASVPLIDSLEVGQPDALFALAAAVTWRYRDSWHGAAALGALIAAKLLAAPLLLWLLVTRRFRSFWFATASSVFFLLASWAAIGFRGFASYPKLLAADARAFEAWHLSLSLPGALIHAGLSEPASRSIAVALALLVSAVIVALARDREHGWFVAALTFGLLASPIMWLHYLVILFVPVAISRRGLSVWLLPSGVFWIAFLALSPSGELRSWTAIAAVITIAVWSVTAPRNADAERTADVLANDRDDGVCLETAERGLAR